jgi:hypothetical protein
VYPKLHCFIHFLIVLALGAAGIAGAHAQSPPPPAQSAAPVQSAPPAAAVPVAAGIIRGHITDPTGALIPGASVTITNAAGTQPVTVTADASGAYEVHGLAPGGYIVTATFEGFAPAQSATFQLAAGQAKRVDIAMAIQVEQQNVVVTDDSPTVNTEAGGNASALVLKGKDLDALSDDPDELSSELSALAGPSAGPNGGQIFIDGFTGGQLPPKSAIREIRINQNPFSAEYDRLGYGRIEILTKPGTDKLHGQGFIQGNDNSFNTSNPFAKTIPSYHSIQFNGTVNGALSKTASFFFTAEQRNNQNDSIYDAQTAVLESSGLYAPGLVTGGILSPQTRTNISPRIDFQLGKSNTFTLRYQFYRNAQSGQLGQNPYVLPTQANSSTSIENTVQFSDSIILTERAVNEIRFQYLRDTESTTPVNGAPSVSVPQFVTAGGSSEQSANDHQDHFELQDLTTMSLGKHAIKFGTRLRNNRDANYTNAGFNGSFNFSNLPDYVGALNQTLGKPCPSGVVCTPNKLTYSAGGTAFTANVFDAAAFIQDDVRLNKFLTMSGGLRFESQNHVSDHDDWGPRAAFAYALDGHKNSKQAKTVLRGGFGIFYDRFSLADELSATRQSLAPDSQKQYVITNPTCFSPTSLKDIELSTCGPSSAQTNTIIQVAHHYHSPMTQQFGASIERQLTKSTTLTGTYLHSFGVHELVTRDSNAYLPGTYLYGSATLTGVRPDPALGIVEQFYPEAVFKQDQMIINVNARISPNLSLLGFYNLTAANSDGGAGSNASNSYNISQDYGRASFASRNMVFAMANYMGPWALRFNPFLIAQAGRPFNVVTLNDLTGDNFFNSRPALAASASCQGENDRYALTPFGCLDTEPQSNDYTPIPTNLGNGPAAVALNLRVSRAWGIGPKLASNANNGQQQGGGPGGPGGGPGGGRGGPGGGPGGGLGPGGLGGGGRGMGAMFAPTATGRKYTLTFSGMASNLFNNINYGTPSGAVAPVYDSTTNEMTPGSRFGQSLNLNGGPFSQGSASRVIRIQAVFAF